MSTLYMKTVNWKTHYYWVVGTVEKCSKFSVRQIWRAARAESPTQAWDKFQHKFQGFLIKMKAYEVC